MQQEISLASLVERTLERVHQVGRQLAYESYGVGKEEGQIVNHHLSYGSVECGKEFVLGEHLTLGKEVHDGGLAHVGVAHERHTNHSATVLALGVLLLVNLSKAFLQEAHAAENDTAVHLQLGLTRSAKTYRTLSAARSGTATLAFQVRPESLQARQHVAVLCQFHLRLGGSRLGTHGKDVENERGAVENLHLQFLLDVAYLLGREFVIEDNHTYLAVFLFLALDVLLNFLQFSFPYVGGLVRGHHLLGEPFYGDGTCRVGEELQLVEVFLGLCLVLVFGDEAHEHGGLCLYLGYYKFFHSVGLYVCLSCVRKGGG